MAKCWRRGMAFRGLAVLVMSMAAAWSASAACPEPAEDTDVAVGIRLAPPFITEDSIRGQRGFALELWQSVERELQGNAIIGKTELIECSLNEQLAALEAGKLDVVISPLTITAKRMAKFDFSHQYLGSGITIARQSGDVINFSHSMRILSDTVRQPGVPRVILIFLAVNLVMAGLMFLALRSHVAYAGSISKEPRLLRVLRTAIETVTRTTGLEGTSGDFHSTLSKVLDVLLAVIGTLLSATIFGVLTAALIGSIGANDDVSVAQLPGLRLATLASSTSQSLLEQLDVDSLDTDASSSFVEDGEGKKFVFGRQQIPLTARGRTAFPGATLTVKGNNAIRCVPADKADKDARCITTDSWMAAMRLLAAGEVDGVVGDWAQLSYLARLPIFGGDLHVQSAAFRNEPYGWGINSERPELRAAIDQALMERIRNLQWRFFVQEYLGRGSIGSN